MPHRLSDASPPKSRTINILLTSFGGLGLPPTLSIPTPADSTISDLVAEINRRLPSNASQSRLLITTNKNQLLDPCSKEPVSSLLAEEKDTILNLRLTIPLCGGKGGFGSQLRAAGGRMSSRKKRNQGENNGSSRNLDGRRLRTIAEAKALAEYLATKPDIDKKEKEERRKKWAAVIESTERRMEEIKNPTKGKLDAEWLEQKEEVEAKAREAALRMAELERERKIARIVEDAGEGSSSGEDKAKEVKQATQPTQPKLFGWDEDDEFMSDDDEDEAENDSGSDQSALSAEEKGKGKAVPAAEH